MNPISNLGPYAKAIVAAALAVLLAYRQIASDGTVTTAEWWSLVIVAVAALGGVFAVPNIPAPVAAYAKAITAAIVAALGVIAAAFAGGGGIDATVLINAAVALFGSLGIVAATPNAVASDDPGVVAVSKQPMVIVTGDPGDPGGDDDDTPVPDDANSPGPVG